MVPEDQELDRQDHSSSMGSSRGGLLGISGSPARSSPRHTGNGSHAVHRCVQLGLGSLTRLTLDSGSAFLRSPHINILEMQAVISAVREFLPHLRSIVVRLMCDNAVTGCLHQEWMGTRSYTLMQVMIRLLKWCNRKAIRLVPVHQADAVSRIGQILNTEWMLAMERLRPVFYKWGEPQIDMFATFSNRRLIKFVSPYPHPRAEWTDAMSTSWDNGRGLLYAFPSLKLVPQVLQKI